MDISKINNNLKQIHHRIKKACHRTRRDYTDVRLEIVTKGVEPEIVDQLTSLKENLFGENRIKQTEINKLLFTCESEIHMIGHLDTNDAKKAIELYHLIESVDSIRLAEKINFQSKKVFKIMPIFLQLKTDCQFTKHGFAEEEFLGAVRQITAMSNLKIMGLMTLPPLTDNSENSRSYFQKLVKIKRDLENKLGLIFLNLSMGTSQDFEVAIEEGANIVRLGRSIFGYPTRSVSLKKVL